MDGLAAYYQSPGRLAGLRRRFESAFRQPGLDPATFATDLGMLAIQGFGDMKEQARDTMIRDKFIVGQGQCALRRQLDGFAQGTPIGEIVDSCRVWESHSDSNGIPTGNYDSEVGSNRRSGVGAVHLQQVKTRWPHGANKQNRVKNKGQKLRKSPGNKRRFERGGGGQPLGPQKIRAQLTLVGAPDRISKRDPLGRYRGTIGCITNGWPIVGNSHTWGRRRRPERTRDRPVPVTPKWTDDRWANRHRSPEIYTGRGGRLKTFGRFREGSVMLGHGESRKP